MTEEQRNAQAEDEALKRTLLKISYDELLDATKHQDDKIGRILTGIAFLTAAVLAFANQSGVGISTRFDLIDRDVPLLAYAVGAFLSGVVISVSLLLSSLTTGLTLPGSKAPKAWTPDDKKKSSLIYFYSIARVPKGVWQARWQEPATTLRADLDKAYVEETFNLALRTNHKYTRTNEAVAVLAFTLFSLGTAFVLASSIAASRHPGTDLVRLTWQARAALAAFVGVYVAIQVVVARREHLLRLRTSGKTRADDPETSTEFTVYQFAFPGLATALVFPGRSACERLVAAVVVAFALVAIGAVVARRQEGRTERLLGLLVVAGVLACVLVFREETWRLLAAAAVPFVLMVRNLIEQWRRSVAPEDPSPEPGS